MTLFLINIFIIASTALIIVLMVDLCRNIYLTEKQRRRRKNARIKPLSIDTSRIIDDLRHSFDINSNFDEKKHGD